MAATSFAPLIVRIEEVLRDGAGSARTLPAAKRFATGYYPDEGRASVTARSKRIAVVYVSDMFARLDSQETGPKVHYDVVVALDLYYYAGHEQIRNELRDFASEAADDFYRVRAALSFPGNLIQTSAGQETGLAGGALEGGKSKWHLDPIDMPARRLSGRGLIPGVVILTSPT